MMVVDPSIGRSRRRWLLRTAGGLVMGMLTAAAAAQSLPWASTGTEAMLAQGSRDALFAPSTSDEKDDEEDEKAAEPAPAGSRDALFGAGGRADKAVAPAPFKASGFVEALAAYTYGKPTHWSRGVARLNVAGTGQIADGVKYKVGARVDADLVYFTSDFYRDEVKRDQRVDAFWGENYLDFSGGGWDFRLGAQQIVWGEVVGLFFADVVSARDMREFLLPSFDVIRIPQWAARAEYFAGDSHLEFIYIPVPAFDRIGKPGADFYPAPLPAQVSDDLAVLFRDPERPARTFENGNFGVRANTLVSGYDLSAFFYRSFSTQPTFYRQATGDPRQPVVFQPRYDRISQIGGTLSKDFGDVVLRAEAVYTRGQGFSTVDPQGDGVVKRSTFDWIVGGEIALPNDGRLNVQAFQRVFSGGDDGILIDYGDVGASVFASMKMGAAWEPQLLWIYYFNDAGNLARPRLNWYAAPNWTVAFGVDVFSGGENGFFGRFRHRDRTYAEFRYTF